MFKAKQESESYRKLGLYGSNRNWGFRCNFPEKTDTPPARKLRLGPKQVITSRGPALSKRLSGSQSPREPTSASGWAI